MGGAAYEPHAVLRMHIAELGLVEKLLEALNSLRIVGVIVELEIFHIESWSFLNR